MVKIARKMQAQTTEIQIIDDDPVVRDILNRILAGKDYVITIHSDAKSAIEDASQRVKEQSRGPDVVLQDYLLPDMAGYVLLCQLWQAYPQAMFVVLTARPLGELPPPPQDCPPVRLLEKPFTADAILSLIRCCLDEA